jgi:nucleotide-binding universal stress UspA family protein
MCTVLVPVDGSENSDRAVSLVVRLHAELASIAVHLLHVQMPVMLREDGSASSESHQEPAAPAAEEALKSAKELLDGASVPYTREVARGYVASTIVERAKVNRCEAILMGTRGMGSSEELLGSIARQVIQLANVPVTLVK